MFNFNGNTPKKILFNGLNVAKLIYNGVVVWLAKVLTTITGYPITLTNSTGDNLVDYKIYGNSIQNNLPDEYQQVEYIETDGNAYIDTGIVPNAYTKMVETFQLNTATYTAVAGIAGVIENTVNYRFSFYTNHSSVVNKNQISSGIGYTFNSADVPEMDTNIHTFEMYQDDTTQYFVADGTTLTSSSQINSANLIANSAWVGYRNDLRASKSIGISHKIYRFSMYTRNSFTEAFTPQINLIPCYRKSDNVIGLYDIVNQTFYTNAGTGTFEKGNNITPTPDTPVEIQSVGDKTKNICPGFNYNYPSNDGMATYKFPVKANTYYSIHFDSTQNAYKTVWLYDTDNNISKLISYAYQNTNYNKMVVLPKQDGYMSVGIVNNNAKVIVAEGLYYTLNATQTNNLNNNQITTSVSGGTLDYEPYGYKIPVKVRGKNLFDKNDITRNKYLNYLGVEKSDAKWCISKYIKVMPNTVYTMSGNGGAGTEPSTCYYDKNKNFISGEAKNGPLFSITTPSDAVYMRYTLRIDNLDTSQCELGTEQTPYDSYVEPNTTNIYLDEPLRKLGNYKDYIDFENGKVIRNTMYRSFTGNETISLPGSVIKGYTPFRYLDLNTTARQPFLCNYLTFSNKEYSQSSTECLAKYATSGQMFFVISNDRIPLNDTTAFKNWLKELYLSDNPLKVYYGLATPIEETIELPNIPTHKGTNIIEVDTTILPSNMEVKYYGKER